MFITSVKQRSSKISLKSVVTKFYVLNFIIFLYLEVLRKCFVAGIFESSDSLPLTVPYTLVNIKNCNNEDQLTFLWCPGIPELGYPEVEPILIDEINLALGAGPDGYRATFRNIEAFGVSNLTVTGVRWVQLTVNTQPNLTFQHYSHMLVNYNWVTILLICTMQYSFYNKTIKIKLRNHKLFSLLFSNLCSCLFQTDAFNIGSIRRPGFWNRSSWWFQFNN